jgi:succinyl-CoA synthetase alpha subunit
MPTRNLIYANRYQDSVTLMQAAERLRTRAGIADAALMMGTDPNKEMLAEAGLLAAEGQAAGPNDLIIAVTGADDALAGLDATVEDLLRAPVATGGAALQEAPHSLAAGLAAQPDTNLVLISTPGLYAAAEARKALMQGRHVMIFSDNVSLDDEAALKALAGERGLLLMGPDCGTAIVGGVPLGFANTVRRGTIGVVGASGTGMQEITTLIDSYGGGISHALGTGSHDLSARIGGAMTLAGLRALLADPATEVVVVVSKPPAPEIAARVLDAASGATKPVVFAFLGMDRAALHPNRGNSKLTLVDTLEDAARQAVAFAGITTPAPAVPDTATPAARSPEARYVRGLFSGGTFCYEAMLQLRARLGEPIHSNIPLTPDAALPDPAHSSGHTCIDMGADSFTVGRPHPMIDLAPRAARLLAEAADPTVAVLLLDVVLGYGAHPDPTSVLAPAIQAARQAAGRDLPVVVHLCGTPADPQGLEAQAKALTAAGAMLTPSNAAAARLAADIASHG